MRKPYSLDTLNLSINSCLFLIYARLTHNRFCCLITPGALLLFTIYWCRSWDYYDAIFVALGYLKGGSFCAGGFNLLSIKLIELMRIILSLESVRFS